MENFMNSDFNITNIILATYVKPGTGEPIHKNRASHGIAVNISPNSDDTKKYVFSDNKTVLVGQNEIVYMPKGSSYTVSSKNSGNCYAINFDISENNDFEPFFVIISYCVKSGSSNNHCFCFSVYLVLCYIPVLIIILDIFLNSSVIINTPPFLLIYLFNLVLNSGVGIATFFYDIKQYPCAVCQTPHLKTF